MCRTRMKGITAAQTGPRSGLRALSSPERGPQARVELEQATLEADTLACVSGTPGESRVKGAVDGIDLNDDALTYI